MLSMNDSNNVCGGGFAEGGRWLIITNYPITCFHQAASKDRVKSHDVCFIVICVCGRVSIYARAYIC